MLLLLALVLARFPHGAHSVKLVLFELVQLGLAELGLLVPLMGRRLLLLGPCVGPQVVGVVVGMGVREGVMRVGLLLVMDVGVVWVEVVQVGGRGYSQVWLGEEVVKLGGSLLGVVMRRQPVLLLLPVSVTTAPISSPHPTSLHGPSTVSAVGTRQGALQHVQWRNRVLAGLAVVGLHSLGLELELQLGLRLGLGIHPRLSPRLCLSTCPHHGLLTHGVLLLLRSSLLGVHLVAGSVGQNRLEHVGSRRLLGLVWRGVHEGKGGLGLSGLLLQFGCLPQVWQLGRVGRLFELHVRVAMGVGVGVSGVLGVLGM